ncbi:MULTISPECIES: hypothetical protein [Corynebacterium]|uniref:hypothetical protein n=1 Tax=Corynebacterium TaxID=1716 RepID=UPI0011CC3BDB|nr:hypothetical protein [Corynebacterium sp. LK14]TXS64630.1 hypothetical protein CHU71_04395 [Corynebacterium sp. LK14]HAT1360258.1 hypothetical protein [Corynebacterium striatum]
MLYELDLVSPEGTTFNLIADGAPGPIAVEAGTIESLVGTFEDNPKQAVGIPGQIINFEDRVVSPLTGSIGFVIEDPESWHKFRRAWSTWEYSWLVLSIGGAKFRLAARLQAAFAFPSSIPKRGDRVVVDMISDSPGAWTVPVASEGSVTVTNYGDVPVWPEIVWDGPGGEVILPSGATFTLPAVDELHRLPLARSNSGRIFNAADEYDRDMSRKVGAVGEMVPRGKERVYTIPDGARLEWEIGVFDPFAKEF